MFSHSFVNTFRILVRRREVVFWSLVFPLILALLFYLALGNLGNHDKIEPIPVSVEKSLMRDPHFAQFMKQMEAENIFEVTVADSDELLRSKKVAAHIRAFDEIVVNGSGIKESVTESVLGEFLHNRATITKLLRENPKANISDFFNAYGRVEDKSNPGMNIVNTYFYVLIGMQALYGYIWGLNVIYQYEANLSTEAKRNTVSPINKRVAFLTATLVAWLINIAVMLINIAFIKFILGIDFGGKIAYILLLVVVAALTGVSFGTLIGVSNKRDIEFKSGLGIAISMLMSFLAGMMIADLKIIIQNHAPIIHKLNPVALISDGMYSLYYYPTLGRYLNDLMWLLGITLAFIAATLLITRGRKYDSL